MRTSLLAFRCACFPAAVHFACMFSSNGCHTEMNSLGGNSKRSPREDVVHSGVRVGMLPVPCQRPQLPSRYWLRVGTLM